jgi:molybdopterin-guanine dinucleotide biosynthesis protein
MLVVVGGHTRNIGKTSLVAGLIAALPELNWTAIKITQYGHGVCSTDGESCECAVVDPEHPYAISEETEATSTDSGRFFAAGAKRSFWVRTATGQLGQALPELKEIIEGSENTIVESNSILQFFKPDLFLAVLDFASEDFKKTSLLYLDRADAVVMVVNEGVEQPHWRGVSPQLWASKKRFTVHPPQYVTEAMVAFAKGRLSSSTMPSGGTSAGTSAIEDGK